MQEPEALAAARLHGAQQGHVVCAAAVVIVGAEEGERLQRHQDVCRLHLGVVRVGRLSPNHGLGIVATDLQGA